MYSISEVEIILKDGPILIYNDTGLLSQFSSHKFSCIGHKITIANPLDGCSKLIMHHGINHNQYGIVESAVYSNDYTNTYTFVLRGKCSLHHKSINLADAKVTGAIIVNDNEDYFEAPFDQNMKSQALIQLEKECSKKNNYSDKILCEEKINEYKRLEIVSIMIKKSTFSTILENVKSHRSSNIHILVHPTDYCTRAKKADVQTSSHDKNASNNSRILNYRGESTMHNIADTGKKQNNNNNNKATKESQESDIKDVCRILLGGDINNRQRNRLMENVKHLMNANDYEQYCSKLIYKQEL